MNGSIYIELDRINEVITRMAKLEERLSTIVDSEKAITKNLAEYWQGDTGNKSFDELNKHSANYETYLTTLKNQTDFLRKTRQAYIDNNNLTNTKIDENANL